MLSKRTEGKKDIKAGRPEAEKRAEQTMGMMDFLKRLFRTSSNPRPGLYVYQVSVAEQSPIAPIETEEISKPSAEDSSGNGRGRRRFHLRVHKDGSGLLFVDLGDPVHLNPTAAMLVWCALEGCGWGQTLRRLRRWFPKGASSEKAKAVETVFAWVDRLKSGGVCCALSSLAEIDALDVSLTCRSQPQPGVPAPPASNGSPPTSWAELKPMFSLPVQAPYKADVALLYGCNNQCGHCYNLPERGRQPPMSMQTWRHVVRKLADLGVPHVILTGGEPTLCEDLPERIHLARQYGLVVGLNTNGRRLADPAFTARLAQSGLDHVQITLLSSRPEVHNRLSQGGAGQTRRQPDPSAELLPSSRSEGEPGLCQAGWEDHVCPGNPFAETVCGIQNALAAGLYTLTNTTLTKHNAQEAETLVDFLYQLGIRTFAMNSIIRSGRGKEFSDALAEEELGPVLVRVRDRAAELGMRFLWYTPTCYCRFSPLELELGPRRCNAAQYSICIEPNGDVLPCQSYYQPVGNLLRDPWPAVWESPLFRRWRDRVQDPVGAGLPESCWQCPDLPVCGGGCMLAFSEALGRGLEMPLSEPRSGGTIVPKNLSGRFWVVGPWGKESS